MALDDTDADLRRRQAALHAAKERVISTSPYLAPDEPIMQAMQTAVLRGVKIDMVVPKRSDQILASAAGRSLDWRARLGGWVARSRCFRGTPGRTAWWRCWNGRVRTRCKRGRTSKHGSESI